MKPTTTTIKKFLLNNLLPLIAFATMLFTNIEANAHWTTKGPYGGSVSAFTTIDTTVFLASPTGGVYASTNSSLTTWAYRNYQGLATGHISSLTHIGRRLIAGTDSGIYISNNLGVLWAVSNNGLGNTPIQALITAGAKIYAGTPTGIFFSSDSGATWNASNTGLLSTDINAFTAANDTVFAGTNGGVFVTVNNGGSWLPLNTGLTDLHVNALAISADGLFAGTPSGVFQGSLLTGWVLVNSGLANTNIHTLLVANSYLYAGTDAGIFSTPTTSILFSATGTSTDTVSALVNIGTQLLAGTLHNSVLKTTIGTSLWTVVNTGFNNLLTYAAAAKDSLIIVANEKGVFVCKNYVAAAVFVSANDGLSDSLHVNALAIANGKLYAGTTSAGIFVSNDTGATWTTVNAGLTNMNIRKLKATTGLLYTVANTGDIYSTSLIFTAWAQQVTGLPQARTVNAITSIGDTVYVALGTDGLYFNTGNSTWVSADLAQNVTSVTTTGTDVYAGTEGAGVFKTNIGYTDWTAVNYGITSLDIQTLQTVDAYILAGYKGGVVATCNGAKTWHTFGTLNYIPNYSSVATIVDITPRMFALTPEHGLLGNGKVELPEAAPDTLTKLNWGALLCGNSLNTISVIDDIDATDYTWTLPNGWTGTSNTHSITINSHTAGSGIVMVSASNGCGASPVLSDSVIVVTCTGIDETTATDINVYPNPFTNQLVIEMEGISGMAKVTMTDITGRVVISNETKDATTGFTIQTAGLAKGVYMLSIVANGKSISVRKVVKTE